VGTGRELVGLTEKLSLVLRTSRSFTKGDKENRSAQGRVRETARPPAVQADPVYTPPPHTAPVVCAGRHACAALSSLPGFHPCLACTGGIARLTPLASGVQRAP
jgi:hypothetical protein